MKSLLDTSAPTSDPSPQKPADRVSDDDFDLPADSSEAAAGEQEELVPHFKPNITVEMVDHFSSYAGGRLPQVMEQELVMVEGQNAYYPVVHVSEFWLLRVRRPCPPACAAYVGSRLRYAMALTAHQRATCAGRTPCVSADAMRDRCAEPPRAAERDGGARDAPPAPLGRVQHVVVAAARAAAAGGDATKVGRRQGAHPTPEHPPQAHSSSWLPALHRAPGHAERAHGTLFDMNTSLCAGVTIR